MARRNITRISLIDIFRPLSQNVGIGAKLTRRDGLHIVQFTAQIWIRHGIVFGHSYWVHRQQRTSILTTIEVGNSDISLQYGGNQEIGVWDLSESPRLIQHFIAKRHTLYLHKAYALTRNYTQSKLRLLYNTVGSYSIASWSQRSHIWDPRKSGSDVVNFHYYRSGDFPYIEKLLIMEDGGLKSNRVSSL